MSFNTLLRQERESLIKKIKNERSETQRGLIIEELLMLERLRREVLVVDLTYTAVFLFSIWAIVTWVTSLF